MSENATAKSFNTHYNKHESRSGLPITIGLLITNDIPGARELGSPPLDVMNHTGNVATSVMVGSLAYLLMQVAEEKFNKKPRGDKVPGYRRTVAAVMAAGALGFGVNSLVETDFGMEHAGQYYFDFGNTIPDPVDLAYGTLAAGTMAGVTAEVERRTRKRGASGIQKPAEQTDKNET
jgi:hypothetical protein